MGKRILGTGIFCSFLCFFFLSMPSAHGYQATTGDAQLLEKVDLTLKSKLAKSNNVVPVMIRVQNIIQRVLRKLTADTREKYLLSRMDEIFTTNIAESEIGQPVSNISGTGNENHLFASLGFGGITFDNYVSERGPVGGEFPDFRMTLTNAGTGKLLGDVLLACGQPGFLMYQIPKATRISIDENKEAIFKPAFIHPDLNSMMSMTGTVSIECRVYDIHYTRDYYSSSIDFEVLQPYEEYHEITLEGVAQDLSYRTLNDDNKDSINMSLYFRNTGNIGLSGSVSAACARPGERKDYEESLKGEYYPILSIDEETGEEEVELEQTEVLEIGFSSFAGDILPGQVVGRTLSLSYSEYSRGDVIECRIDPEINEHIFLKKDLPVSRKTERVK